MPFVSIIVPVYNVEKYLARCIESIIMQSFVDWELILINDGSLDESGRICNEYSKKDSRIIVYHKKNGGVSSARNFGLHIAKGKWVAFVDSDDFVGVDYIRNMISENIIESCIVYMNYQPEIQVREGLYSKESMVDFYVNSRLPEMSGPVSKLFNMSIIRQNNIRFDTEIHMGEDAVFVLNYMCHINNLYVINKSFVYSYDKHENSLSNKYYSFDSEYKCFVVWKECLERFLRKYNHLSEKEIEKNLWTGRLSMTFLRAIQSLVRYNPPYTYNQFLKYVNSVPTEYTFMFGKYYIPLKMKSKLLCYLIKHRLFSLFYIILLIADGKKYHNRK